MRIALVLCAACAVRPIQPVRAIRPVRPGEYWFDRRFQTAQSTTSHTVSLVLDPAGAARASLSDWFLFVAERPAELERNDENVVDLAGSWQHRGNAVDIQLEPVRSCARGFDLRWSCKSSSDRWQLRCEASGDQDTLVCERLAGELPPKYAVRVDGEPRLVLRSNMSSRRRIMPFGKIVDTRHKAVAVP
jgi:hypothetical protein